jgi:hypothetical protein
MHPSRPSIRILVWLIGDHIPAMKRLTSLASRPLPRKKYWPLMGSFLKELTIKTAATVTIEFMKTIW